MNIDISNAHCGPRIQFPDHAWLRVVLVSIYCLRPASADGYIGGWRTSDRWTFARLCDDTRTTHTLCVSAGVSLTRSIVVVRLDDDEMREKKSESVTSVRACHPWASSEMTRGVMTESVEGGGGIGG